VVAKKFSDLRAKLMPATREKALRQTQCMLVDISPLQKNEFFAQRADTSKQGDLARMLLQVKAREPLAGDELPR
jgi:hypothetical protein